MKNALRYVMVAFMGFITITATSRVCALPELVDDINKTTDVKSEILSEIRADGLLNGKALYLFDNTSVGPLTGLWAYDGISPERIYDDYLGSINEVKVIGDTGYFIDAGALWKTDGTRAGTVQVKMADFSGHIQKVIQLDSDLIFATGGVSQHQLWKSDGSEAGTVLLNTYSALQYSTLTMYQNALYFSADDGLTGSELWKTDGTVSGTELVKDIRPDLGKGSGGNPGGFRVYNDKLFFAALGPDTGRELWMTDGTQAGTQLFFDIKPGRNGGNPILFTLLNNELHFAVYNLARNDYSLWKTDGTVPGTIQVVRTLGGEPIYHFFAFNGELYSTVYNRATSEYELWKTDGTESGTVLVKDGFFAGGGNRISDFIIVDQTLFFTAADSVHGRELWKTDGTSSGTVIVKDIRPGSKNGIPGYAIKMASFNNELYFMAKTRWNDFGLWKTDGTERGTVPVMDVTDGRFETENEANPATYTPDLLVLNNELHFVASSVDNASGDTWEGFWKTTGANNDVELVAGIRQVPTGSSKSQSMFEINGKTLFFADDGVHGYQLRETDGTSSWPIVDKGFKYIVALYEFNGDAYFRVANFDGTQSNWKTDGSSAGTSQITSPPSLESGVFLRKMNGVSYFFATDNALNETVLWKTNGTQSGAVKVKAGFTLQTKSRKNTTVIANTLYFTADDGITGMELWKTDGTASGTVIVKDIRTGTDNYGRPRGSFPHSLEVIGNELYFRAEKPSYQYKLYKTDGTAAGTAQVLGIQKHTTIGDRLYFLNTTAAEGTELWSMDTVTQTANLVRDITPGAESTSLMILGELNNSLLFITSDVTNNRLLWKTNGTDASTVIVSDTAGLPFDNYGGTDYNILASTNNKIYFSIPGFSVGQPIAVTDGTAAGTRLIQNSGSGRSGWLQVSGGVVINGDIYFVAEVQPDYNAANTGNTGRELWKIDNNTAMATLVADVNPGHSDGVNSILGVVNNTIYLSANDGTGGYELWRYSLAASPGTAEFGDLVWNDVNGNGVQDASESGLPGIVIDLQTCSGQFIRSTTTGNDGSYAFSNLQAGDYQLQFRLPPATVFSPEKSAGNYQLDSNANVITGITQCYTMAAGQERLSIDAGMIPVAVSVPSMSLSVSANDQLTKKPGPVLTQGTAVNWTYSVTNDGNMIINDVIVRGRQKIPALGNWETLCTIGSIQPDTSSSCTTTDTAIVGNYKSLIVAKGLATDGTQLEELFSAFYVGEQGAVADTVTVVKAIYFSADNKLWVRAESDATPAGSANLTATILTNGSQSDLGTIGWKANKGFYQQVFFNVTEIPESVTLTSDQGGTVSSFVEKK